MELSSQRKKDVTMGGLELFSEFQIIKDVSWYSHYSNIFSEVCCSAVFKGHVNYLSCRYCYRKTWLCCANLGVATPFDKGLHQWIFLIDFFDWFWLNFFGYMFVWNQRLVWPSIITMINMPHRRLACFYF